MLTCKGLLDPPFRAFSRRAWVACGSATPSPTPPQLLSMARTDRAQLWQTWCLMLVSPSLPLFPLSLPPASLEVWLELAGEGSLQASILDGLGGAAPAVLVGTSIPLSQLHRHLGACPCLGREDSLSQKNRGLELMPEIRLESGGGLSNLTLAVEHGL